MFFEALGTSAFLERYPFVRQHLPVDKEPDYTDVVKGPIQNCHEKYSGVVSRLSSLASDKQGHLLREELVTKQGYLFAEDGSLLHTLYQTKMEGEAGPAVDPPHMLEGERVEIIAQAMQLFPVGQVKYLLFINRSQRWLRGTLKDDHLCVALVVLN